MRKWLLIALLFPLTAFSQTTNIWRGLTNNAAWSDSTAWSLGSVPDFTQVALFSTNHPAGVGSNRSCRVDVNIGVSSIILTNYTGTLTSMAGLTHTISNNLVVGSGGSFKGSNSTMTIVGSYQCNPNDSNPGMTLYMTGTGTLSGNQNGYYQEPPICGDFYCGYSNQTTRITMNGSSRDGPNVRTYNLMGGTVIQPVYYTAISVGGFAWPEPNTNLISALPGTRIDFTGGLKGLQLYGATNAGWTCDISQFIQNTTLTNAGGSTYSALVLAGALTNYMPTFTIVGVTNDFLCPIFVGENSVGGGLPRFGARLLISNSVVSCMGLKWGVPTGICTNRIEIVNSTFSVSVGTNGAPITGNPYANEGWSFGFFSYPSIIYGGNVFLSLNNSTLRDQVGHNEPFTLPSNTAISNSTVIVLGPTSTNQQDYNMSASNYWCDALSSIVISNWSSYCTWATYYRLYNQFNIKVPIPVLLVNIKNHPTLANIGLASAANFSSFTVEMQGYDNTAAYTNAFTLNGYQLQADSLTFRSGGTLYTNTTRYVGSSNSAIIINSNLVFTTLPWSFDSSNSTIVAAGTGTFRSNLTNYNNLVANAAWSTPSNSVSKTLSLTNAAIRMNGTLALTGANGSNIVLNTITPGSVGTITLATRSDNFYANAYDLCFTNNGAVFHYGSVSNLCGAAFNNPSGVVNLSITNVASGSWTNGPTWTPTITPSGYDTSVITGYTVTADANFNAGTITFTGGTLTGTGNGTISNQFFMTGGTLDLSGLYTNACSVFAFSNGTFNAKGFWTWTTNTTVLFQGYGATPQFGATNLFATNCVVSFIKSNGWAGTVGRPGLGSFYLYGRVNHTGCDRAGGAVIDSRGRPFSFEPDLALRWSGVFAATRELAEEIAGIIRWSTTTRA